MTHPMAFRMRSLVHTKDNTKFEKWWALANRAFLARGLPEQDHDTAIDAYEMGESPETWAEYVRNS